MMTENAASVVPALAAQTPMLNGSTPDPGDPAPAVRRRLKIGEMRRQAVEALGMEPGMEVECEDGTVFFVSNPMFSPDEVQELLAANKVADAAKAHMGAEEHARFLRHGGHSNDVMLMWRLMRDDMEDALDTKS